MEVQARNLAPLNVSFFIRFPVEHIGVNTAN